MRHGTEPLIGSGRHSFILSNVLCNQTSIRMKFFFNTLLEWSSIEYSKTASTQNSVWLYGKLPAEAENQVLFFKLHSKWHHVGASLLNQYQQINKMYTTLILFKACNRDFKMLLIITYSGGTTNTDSSGLCFQFSYSDYDFMFALSI